MHKKNSVSAQQNPLELEVTNFLAVRENLRSVPEKRQYLGGSRLALVRKAFRPRPGGCVCVCVRVRAFCWHIFVKHDQFGDSSSSYILNTLAVLFHHIS